jgi:hypothetical protein
MSKRAYTAGHHDVVTGWDPSANRLYLVIDDVEKAYEDDDRMIYSNLNDSEFESDPTYIVSILDRFGIPYPDTLVDDLAEDAAQRRTLRHMYPPMP